MAYMHAQRRTATRTGIAEHTVLRNTYFLLGLTLVFSALCTVLSVVFHLSHANIFIHLICLYGLLFLVHATAHSAWGILCTFLFTGYMGLSLGPIVSLVLHGYANGTAIVLNTTACTGLIFLGLSAYTLASGKNYSFMGGTLFMMLFGGIILSLAGLLLQTPLLILATNALFILVFSGLIMYHTSEIIHGGETNYILATISLYLTLYNLFVNLLQLFAMMQNNDRN